MSLSHHLDANGPIAISDHLSKIRVFALARASAAKQYLGLCSVLVWVWAALDISVGSYAAERTCTYAAYKGHGR
jgi:hypothetical protein